MVWAKKVKLQRKTALVGKSQQDGSTNPRTEGARVMDRRQICNILEAFREQLIWGFGGPQSGFLTLLFQCLV